MNNKPWKTVEKVVRLLESVLDPQATVTHDVKLTDHRTGGHRQCDTVIVSGIEARRTTTIVEVQDRNDPMGISDLEGFYQKMQNVRAQQLLCVTRTGFTDQAKAFARSTGPTIRLLTLSELEQGEWPINFAFGRFMLIENESRAVHMQLQGSPRDDYALDKVRGRDTADVQARILELREQGRPSRVISVSDLFEAERANLPFCYHREAPYRYRFDRKFGGSKRLRVKLGRRKYDVGRAEVHVEITTRRHFIPIRMMSYEQEEFDGTLGWSALAVGDIEGKPVQIRIAYLPDTDGRLAVAGYEIEGVWRAGPMMYQYLDTDEEVLRHKNEIAAYEQSQASGDE
ncbi:MAG: restriction endonuclease [Planctomycetes bacterium]|nr:restriction endonuclease [Planctomycetota bacterium]